MNLDLPQAESDLQNKFDRAIRKNARPSWRGVPMLKFPSDIVMYQMAIFEKKPDFIIEIGTAWGASALMFADFLAMNGKGEVITIDPNPRVELINNPKVIMIRGGSTDEYTLETVKRLVRGKTVMVSIDGDHSYEQVTKDLEAYKDIVTPGQYMVAEDNYAKGESQPAVRALEDFLEKYPRRFRLTRFDKPFLVGLTKNGWVIRRK
jgi:cephalosporin hydroxylase